MEQPTTNGVSVSWSAKQDFWNIFEIWVDRLSVKVHHQLVGGHEGTVFETESSP